MSFFDGVAGLRGGAHSPPVPRALADRRYVMEDDPDSDPEADDEPLGGAGPRHWGGGQWPRRTARSLRAFVHIGMRHNASSAAKG